MRNLATVQEISNIESIENADKIQKAMVLGWQVVIRKDEFNIKDKCIFIEIDSLLPNDKKCFEFMAPRKYRTRTIKLRKTISQGLALPLNILKEFKLDKNKYNIGDDLTKELGIVKYESPSDKESNWCGTPKKKHNWFIKYMTRFQWFRKFFHIKSKSFPQWISKTDEERLQNIPWILKDKENLYYTTEKLDGQSATYWYRYKKLFGLFRRDEFGICSRTVRKNIIDNSNWSKAAKEFNIKEKLKSVGKNIAIQGELCGPNIQGNKYKLDKFELFIFNVYLIDEKRYCNIFEIRPFCEMYGFKMVPVLDEEFKLLDNVQEMVELSKGKSKLNKDILREGIVIRCINDHRKSFKTINNDFLLEYNE